MKFYLIIIGVFSILNGLAQPEWEVVNYTNNTTAYCTVTINGTPAEVGDKVGAFVDLECRGIGEIVLNEGIAYSSLQIQGESIEPVNFKVWDNSASEEVTVLFDTISNPGGIIGNPPDFLPINALSFIDTIPPGLTINALPDPQDTLFNVTLNFDEAVNGVHEALNVTGAVIDSVSGIDGDSVYIVSIKGEEQALVTLDVGVNVSDSMENNFAGSTHSFTIGDFTSPALISWSPSGELGGVEFVDLKLTFNEGISKGNGSVSLFSEGKLKEQISIENGTIGDSSIIFSNVSVVKSTNYYVLIESGALKDYSGNNYSGLTDSTVWMFSLCGDSIINTEEIKICEGEDYMNWIESGTYERTHTSANGCDSIIITKLTVHSAYNPEVHNSGDTLKSVGTYPYYQWCDINGEIEEAINKEYIIEKSGEYYLKVTDENGCTNTSEKIHAVYSSAQSSVLFDFDYSINPNPNSGKFVFQIKSKPEDGISLKLVNSNGQTLETREIKSMDINHIEQFNISHLSKGVYYLIISVRKVQISEKILIQ